ncbi:hypothetical protein VQH23_15075 [Pararoseomonas sp. SCSIO 73927]|uniref:hypothetical protein n=1 Tax=Pararoseomonas sp. SCSIO 73927 TaxID=3114537 RepID=UPI0030CA7809
MGIVGQEQEQERLRLRMTGGLAAAAVSAILTAEDEETPVTSETQRLKQDLEADAALRARLAPALDGTAGPEAAAALLRAAGYNIAPADLPRPAPGPRRLDPADLDRVAGGANPTRNLKSPFDEPL